jgi:hypothetical protein
VNAIPQISDNRTLQELWYRIVEDYTTRELTYPEVDKLVALSAIASRMCQAMDDVYLVGHFVRMPPESLNWMSGGNHWVGRRFPVTLTSQRLTNPSDRITATTRMKTPSWSWASVNGPLASRANLGSSICLVDTDISGLHQLHHDHSEGQMNTILLRIRTSCAEVVWKEGQPDILGSSK